MKFGTRVKSTLYMLITTLTFTFSKFFSFIFFGQMGTLLYAYYDFSIYCLKIIFIYIFLGKCGPKMWSSSNWLKLGTEVDYYILISILLLIFSKFWSFIFSLGKFGPKVWSSSNWLKCCTGVQCYMLITILMFIFSKF